MKAWNKFLLTTTAITLLAIPLSASALSSTGTPTQAPTAKVVEQKKEQAGTKGLIEEIRHTKDGSFVFIKGTGVNPGDQSAIYLNTNNKVPVVDQHGQPADLVEAVQQGWTVTAYYHPAITKSLPAKGNAEKFVVERPVQAMKATGVIQSAKDDRVFMVGEDRVVLTLSDETVITDAEGNKLKKSDLKENQRIEAHYGPMMTMSLPPISPAVKIVVMEETSRLDGVVTKNVGKDEKSLYVDSRAAKGGKLEADMMLRVNEDTKVIDTYGQPVKLDSIKKGTKVVAYHHMAVAMSYPGQTGAYVIIVDTTAKK